MVLTLSQALFFFFSFFLYFLNFGAKGTTYGRSQGGGGTGGAVASQPATATATVTATATATSMPDLSHICDLHCSSRQHWILNPLREARDQTHILRDTSWALNPVSHKRNSS